MSVDLEFPNPWITETIEDVIAVGGRLTVSNLARAYEMGIFPWPHPGYPLLWFCPEQRGIIEFSEIHVGRSLQKWIRQNQDLIEVKMNCRFSEVVKACRLQKRKGQKGSWINDEIEKSYSQLHQKGMAFSLECYKDGLMISGIYGVQSKNYISCESMFHKIDNASKYAFIKLVERFKMMGHTWMDLQMISEVSGYLGGKYISRDQFLKKIKLKKTLT